MEILLTVLIIGYIISSIVCAYSIVLTIENKQPLRDMFLSCGVTMLFFLVMCIAARMRYLGWI